jgi:putative nucleotidyltransferase with HDIG domain
MIQVADETLFMGLEQTIQAWARSLELSGREAQGHTYRVAELTLRLARKLGTPDEVVLHMVRGALLHDIGQLAVPESVLLKPGKLEPAERALVEQHPIVARSMLQSIDVLHPAIDIPYAHHERWDGKGYPRGLRGTDIPVAARIFAVVDVWDALSHDQPYRSAWAREDILAHLREGAGTQFDPDIVDSFLVLVEEPKGLEVLVKNEPLTFLLRV